MARVAFRAASFFVSLPSLPLPGRRRTLRVLDLLSPLAPVLLMLGCGAEAAVPTDAATRPVSLDGSGDAASDAAADGGAPATMCPSGECDLRANDCPPASDGAARACYWALRPGETTARPQCLPAGAVAEGEPCADAVNVCEAGTTCAFGACRRYCCDGETTSCGVSRVCVSFTDTSGASAGFGICATTCDPLSPTCAATEGCYPRPIDPRAPDAQGQCLPAGDGVAGAACAAGNACTPGLGCLQGSCTQLCDRTGDGSECEVGERCAAVATFGGTVGACLEDV